MSLSEHKIQTSYCVLQGPNGVALAYSSNFSSQHFSPGLSSSRLGVFPPQGLCTCWYSAWKAFSSALFFYVIWHLGLSLNAIFLERPSVVPQALSITPPGFLLHSICQDIVWFHLFIVSLSSSECPCPVGGLVCLTNAPVPKTLPGRVGTQRIFADQMGDWNKTWGWKPFGDPLTLHFCPRHQTTGPMAFLLCRCHPHQTSHPLCLGG